jgi:hypothetical protein
LLASHAQERSDLQSLRSRSEKAMKDLRCILHLHKLEPAPLGDHFCVEAKGYTKDKQEVPLIAVNMRCTCCGYEEVQIRGSKDNKTLMTS